MKQNAWQLFWIVLGLSMLLVTSAHAATTRVTHLSDRIIETIKVRPGTATILSFPTKPKKIVKASSAFDVKYINNDLAITALQDHAESNLFVYLDGRRYGFRLITTHGSDFDEVVIVRDKNETKEKIRVKIYHD